MTTEPKYKPVPHTERVTWVDHFANHTTETFTRSQVAEHVKEDFVNVTDGMLVYEDERIIVLAHEARVDMDSKEALFSHYTAIYRVCILKRVVMEEK